MTAAGYPKITVTTVTAVTRPPCKGNPPAVFPAAVLVADTAVSYTHLREVTGLFAELRQTAVWFLGIYLAVFLIAGLFIYMMMRRTVEQMEKLQEVAEKQELLMGALSHEMRLSLIHI